MPRTHRGFVVTAAVTLIAGMAGFAAGQPAGAATPAARGNGATPPANTFVPTGSMAVARAGGTATLLPNGDVLAPARSSRPGVCR